MGGAWRDGLHGWSSLRREGRRRRGSGCWGRRPGELLCAPWPVHAEPRWRRLEGGVWEAGREGGPGVAVVGIGAAGAAAGAREGSEAAASRGAPSFSRRTRLFDL